jgi:formate dehydrogenase major subunit
MTNHWIDLKNADVIMIIGSNAAENHPVSFAWVNEAVQNGATLISVDPRFTRTSALAHLYAPIRSGTDIAFIGGMINHVLASRLYHETYVREYTNASFLVNPAYSFDPQSGLFSGYDAKKRQYDPATWSYQVDEQKIPKRDPSLKDPKCVFQLLKKHYARYDVDTVSKITGTPKDALVKVYEAFASTGTPERAGTIMYAMGTTQHTNGTQNIRAYTILQLLLGNIGIAGGGVNALRGLANVQGSTDMALLFNSLPGYLQSPADADQTLAQYLERVTPKSQDPKSVNWWKNYPKYMVSLLKAWYGDAAQKDNDFGFAWLPKRGGNYSHIPLFEAMHAGTIKGFFVMGQNPAVGGPNAGMERKALEKLEWLAVTELWETETASFWKRPGVNPTDVKTEVFLLPAASYVEKEGSVTNSGRWVQWRWKAVDPPGQAREDAWILNQLMLRLRTRYADKGGPAPDGVLKLTWAYGSERVDVHKVAKEVNGYATADLLDDKGKVIAKAGDQIPAFPLLRDDGSTACGSWIYSGSYTGAGNMMARRSPVDRSGIGLYSEWGWNWPVNRRILYNRASVHPETGQPWNPRRAVIRWDAEGKKWAGDVPDGPAPPGTVHPFIMRGEGVARLFGAGMADGPFPEHYEPWESPVPNLLSKSQFDPVARSWGTDNARGEREQFPIVATTYRLTEHMQAGAMTRNLPWLVELQPEPFVEMSRELAAELRVAGGERVVVESARGRVAAVAVVTARFKPFRVDGKTVHEVGLPWHWGYAGLSRGDSANVLTPNAADPNTSMPEYKAFLCRIKKEGA